MPLFVLYDILCNHDALLSWYPQLQLPTKWARFSSEGVIFVLLFFVLKGWKMLVSDTSTSTRLFYGLTVRVLGVFSNSWNDGLWKLSCPSFVLWMTVKARYIFPIKGQQKQSRKTVFHWPSLWTIKDGSSCTAHMKPETNRGDRCNLLTVVGLATPPSELFSFLFDHVDEAEEGSVKAAEFLQTSLVNATICSSFDPI